MSEITFNAGIVSIPESRAASIVCWLPRRLAGTHKIESQIIGIKSNISSLEQHIGAMTDIVHVLVADISGKWTPDKRERVQRMIGNFKVVSLGLGAVVAKGNPFTQQELDTLRSYTTQAQEGQIFTPEQATQFRQLSERASKEYAGQDWVGELLKIALFIFALYAIGELLKSGNK